jgi:hypothetical protein
LKSKMSTTREFKFKDLPGVSPRTFIILKQMSFVGRERNNLIIFSKLGFTTYSWDQPEKNKWYRLIIRWISHVCNFVCVLLFAFRLEIRHNI